MNPRDTTVQSAISVLGILVQPHLVSLDLDAPSPSPEAADITIDLSRVLRAQGLAEVPLIRFVPVRWKEGYTSAS